MNTKQNLEKQTIIEQILLVVGGISAVFGTLLALLLFFRMIIGGDISFGDIIYRFPGIYIVVALLGLSLVALSEVIKQIRLSNLQHYTQNSPHESSKR